MPFGNGGQARTTARHRERAFAGFVHIQVAKHQINVGLAIKGLGAAVAAPDIES